MSDNETTGVRGGPKSGWTDRERLVYLVALMETSSPKLDYNNTPRPNGRSLIACQRMVERLKNTVKDDLAALKAGQDFNGIDSPKATPKTAKRKVKGTEDEGSPKKRGRPKKKVEEGEANDGGKVMVKAEDEELGELDSEI